MAYVPRNRARALVIVHEPQAYAPSRVHEAAAYQVQSPSATQEESRLANRAIEWLRNKRDEPISRKETTSSRVDTTTSGSQ